MRRRPEPEALGRLYDRLGPGLYRYAVMILADPVAAEDVVHDVFVAVAARPLTEHADLDRYLRSAVRNGCFSRLRQRTRRQGESDAALLELAAVERPPHERLDLERALRQLPADQREVVHLKLYEGLTFQEIAGVTGESINTVAARYRYALDKLRAALRADGDHDERRARR